MAATETDLRAPEQEIDLVSLIRVMWSYKLLIVGFTVAAALIAIYLALTAIPLYQAEAVIIDVNDRPNGAAGGLAGQLGGLASLAGVNLGAAGGAQLQAQAVLRSRHLAEEFIRRHNLLKELLPSGAEQPTLWAGVEKFQGMVLKITDDKRAGTTTVSVRWRDPAVATQWANQYVALANDMVRARDMENSKRNIEYLNQQIAATNAVDMRNVMYNLIQTETKTLMLANGRTEYAFSVVDPAMTPERRISPRRTLMVLVGTMIGGVVGAIIAFVVHMVAQQRSARLRS